MTKGRKKSLKKEDSLKGENIDHLAIPFLEAKLQNFKNIKYRKIKYMSKFGWVDFSFKNPNTIANKRKMKL